MSSVLDGVTGPRGEQLRPSYRVDGDFMLVVLNDDRPLEEAPPPPQNRDLLLNWSGVSENWEWATQPDFHRPAKAYRDYMPRADRQFLQGDYRDWVFTWNVAMAACDGVPYRFISADATKIRRTEQEARAWADQVAILYPATARDRPPKVEVAMLTRVYKERPTFNMAVWAMRRAVLETYGYICATLLHDKNWRAKGWIGNFVRDIDEMGLLTGPKRGVILGLDELTEERIRTFIEHGVPVHYQWRFRPAPSGAILAFSPLAISAYDYVLEQRQALDAFVRNKTAAKAAGRRDRERMGEGGAAQKGKKRWYKVEEDSPHRIPISAREGKSLAEEWKCDNSESSDAGDVAVIYIGVCWDDDDDDEGYDANAYMAPALPIPGGPPADEPTLAPSTVLDAPQEWPALPAKEDADAMEVDNEDSVSLGDELEVVMDEQTGTATVDPATAQQMLGSASAPVSPAEESAAAAQRPWADERRGRLPPTGPRVHRRAHGRDAHNRSHSVSGSGHRHDDSGERRYRPYQPTWPSRPRTRSRSPPAPAAPQPPPREHVQVAPQPQPMTEDAPATRTPASAPADMATMTPADAHRLLTENLSPVAAQQLLEVLVKQSAGGVDALLGLLAHPEGIPDEGDAESDDEVARPGSLGARIKAATTPRVRLPVSPPVASGSQARPSLFARLEAEPMEASAPLVSRLGFSLSDRLAIGGQSLTERLGGDIGPSASAVEGARMACCDWLRRSVEESGGSVTDTCAFVGSAAAIAPPTTPPAGNVYITWPPRTEVRVRRWFMEGLVHSAWEAAVKAFELGCAFSVWTPAPAEWHPSHTFVPDYPQLPGLPHSMKDKYWSTPALLQYAANVAASGGPRWLVDDLWQRTDANLGRVDYDSARHAITCALSTDEVNTMLGLASGTHGNGSPQMWPPVEMFERSIWDVGQWTARNEAWFIPRARAIRARTGDIEAWTKSKWKGQCRQRGLVRQNSGTESGTIAEANRLLVGISESFPTVLEGVDLVSL
ncbi:hypothetical protein C8R47DRAFT_1212445 [Mycena vitilis]|nr:hypothetical protein C8R47DRAFT_1212445 [Mycena vitilis]